MSKFIVLGSSVLALAASLSIANVVWAGPIRGRIGGYEKLFPDVYAEAAKQGAHRFIWREPSPTVKRAYFELSASPSRHICIAAMSDGKVAAPDPSGVAIRVSGGQTFPTTIVVQPGTKLVFQNHDPFPHRLFDKNNPAWGPQEMGPKGSREWIAPSNQLKFEIQDQLFPSIRMFIVVKPGVATYVLPARDGSFILDVPSGNYTLQAYFQGREVGKPVSVLAKEKGIFDIKGLIDLGEGGSP